MLLTKPQQQRFWRDWSSACRHQGWIPSQGYTPDQVNALRREVLQRCGFTSLTEVDRAAGFDSVLAELGKLGDNISKTIETEHPEVGALRRLLWQIDQLTETLSLPYVNTIAKSRFGHTRLDDLTHEQLTQLRNTLVARSHRKGARSPHPSVRDPELAENPF